MRGGKKLLISLSTAIIIAFSFTSCGNSFEYSFNIDVKELETDIEPITFKTEEVLSLEWGSGEGQIGYIPPSRTQVSYKQPDTFYVSSDGMIYILDDVNQRVVVFNADGSFFNDYAYTIENRYPSKVLANGKGVFYLYYDFGVIASYDLDGNLIAKWNYRERPEEWKEDEWYDGTMPLLSPEGELFMVGREPTESEDDIITITKWRDDGTPIESFNFDKEFDDRRFIAVDSHDNFYVEGYDDNLYIFNKRGDYERSIPVKIDEKNSFKVIGIDKDGNLFLWISSNMHCSIVKYSPKGELLNKYQFDDNSPMYSLIWNMVFTIDGYIYYLNYPNSGEGENVTVNRTKL